MTIILEAHRLSSPDTQSVHCSGGLDVELRRMVTQSNDAIVTSGLPQWASSVAAIPDMPQQGGAKTMGRLDRSYIAGRVYLVKTIEYHQIQGSLRQISDSQMAKHREHMQYLQRVSTDGAPPLISQSTARKSWNLWQMVRKTMGTSMPIPSAGTGPEGMMFYSWDKGSHHLEAEIYTDRETEFFYRNRQTNELWGEDYPGGQLSAELIRKLHLFL